MTAWPVGTTLDERYVITGVLGRGGMGTVMRGRHLVTGAEVAIKVLHPHLLVDPEMAARFLTEARAPAAIDHPGIARVLDAGTSERGDPYLVMDLLSGETLAATMRKGALPLPEIVHIGAEVLDALGAAHAAGFVHRDLKPDNVFLLAGSRAVKVLDFGIAKVLDDREIAATATGALLGTLPYMSPEQLRSAKSVDHRTDLWAAGVMFYEMVTNALPYESDGFGDLLLRILSGPPPPLSERLETVPLGLDDFFRRALAIEPRARFATAGEMASALRAIAPAPLARRERAADSVPISSTQGAPISSTVRLPETEERRVLPPGVIDTVEPADAPPAAPAPSRWRRRLVVLAPLVLVAAAGAVSLYGKLRGPTTGEIVDQHREEAAAVRSRLTAVALAVDAAPGLEADARCTPPRPLRFDSRGWGNTDYLMYTDLPGATPPATAEDLAPLDFHFSNVMVKYYASWSAPGSVLRRDEPATSLFQQTFSNIGRIEYLVVVKPRSHLRAKGEAVVDTFLVELASARVLCGFRVTATGNSAMSPRDYQNQIWQDARRRVFAKARRELDIDGEPQ